jgi:hypothetical protein
LGIISARSCWTDEQQNLICESVAQDLVSIYLNMHSTRDVQKMIDFLSTMNARKSVPAYFLSLRSVENVTSGLM